jgi:hypothetical protein
LTLAAGIRAAHADEFRRNGANRDRFFKWIFRNR